MAHTGQNLRPAQAPCGSGDAKDRRARAENSGQPSTIGVPISNLRQHPRITDSQDLLAGWRSIGRPRRFGRVLNLSEGGMLVDGAEFEVGEVTGFELDGPNFRHTGVAEVAHVNNETTGLRFLCWHRQADRTVDALIQSRSRKQHAATADPRAHDYPAIRRVAVFIPADASHRDPSAI
jgi:hypothetical protein